MEDLEKDFNKYTTLIKNSNLGNLDNNDKLYLYANYKQALFGNNNNQKPSIFDRIEMAKWKEWNSLKNVSKETAMENYIKKVKEILIM
jgi:acyl-CoA-binding protein